MDEKKELAIKFLKQGATRTDALLLADVRLEDHDSMLDDPVFLHHVRQAQAVYRHGLVLSLTGEAKSGGRAVNGLIELLAVLDPTERGKPGTVKRNSDDFRPSGPLALALQPKEPDAV